MAETIAYTSNKTLVQNGNTFTLSRSMNIGTTRVINNGKWYWEVKINTLAPAIYIGVINSNFSYTIENADQSPYSLVLHCGNRYFKYKNTTIAGDLTSLDSGDVIGISVDADTKLVTFYKNGVKFKEIQTDFNDFFPFVGYGATSGTGVVTFNFEKTSFVYTMPQGFTAYGWVNKILILSNGKVYSVEDIDTYYNLGMSSNTNPSPYVASASGVYDNSSSFQPYKAFNGTSNGSNDAWITPRNTPLGWIQIDFGESTKVNKVSITSRDYGSSDSFTPKDFNILGSNDGVYFDIVAEFRDEVDWSTAGNETRHYAFKNNQSYRYYRLDILANNGGSYTAIAEINYGYDDTVIKELPSHSEQNFINYGVYSPVRFDGIVHSKDYILSKEDSEIKDNVRSIQINRKPLSIKLS